MFGRSSPVSRGQYLNKDVPDGLPFYIVKGAMGAWEGHHEWNSAVKTTRYSALKYCEGLNEVAELFNSRLDELIEKVDSRTIDKENQSDIQIRYFRTVAKPHLLEIAKCLDSKMFKEVQNSCCFYDLIDLHGYQIEGLK